MPESRFIRHIVSEQVKRTFLWDWGDFGGIFRLDVKEIMVEKVISIQADTTVKEAVKLMNE